jgi:hypothetical protein
MISQKLKKDYRKPIITFAKIFTWEIKQGLNLFSSFKNRLNASVLINDFRLFIGAIREGQRTPEAELGIYIYPINLFLLCSNQRHSIQDYSIFEELS